MVEVEFLSLMVQVVELVAAVVELVGAAVMHMTTQLQVVLGIVIIAVTVASILWYMYQFLVIHIMILVERVAVGLLGFQVLP
jgi:hypothetical protein